MVKIEGSPSFIAAVRERRGDVLSMHDGPAKHLIIEAFQRRLVHNAMALARVSVLAAVGVARPSPLRGRHAPGPIHCCHPGQVK
jgi:hypothetical protein